MKRYVFVLTAAAISALCTTARSEITVTPSEPTIQDEVQVTVSRWTNTGGYHIDDMTVRVTGTFIQMDLFWSTPAPGTGVTMAFVLHERTHSLGQLSPGLYTVRATHHGIRGWGDSASFVVSDPEAGDGDCPDEGEEDSCGCICHLWPQMFAGKVCPFCGCGGQNNSDDESLFDRIRNRMSWLAW